jgi:S1-C subfamily serine protease
MLAGSAARAAEPQATPAQQATDAEVRAKIDAEAQSRNAAQMKIDAEVQARGAAQAKVDAEAQARSATHAKIDAEAARRDLEQMREQMRELSKRMAELSLKLGDVGPRTYAYRYFGDPDRGMIGVVLGKDDHGLRINAVTPGGPADKAGVKNGDVIVTVDGVDLTKTPANAPTPQVLHDLKVGQEVKVTVVRDGKKVDATMKAERREPFNMSLAIDHAELGKLKKLDEMQALGELGAELPPDYERRIQMQVEQATREAEREVERSERNVRITEHANEQMQRAMQRVKVSMPWWGLNLANLNPDLGAYFGTDHGVLVLSTDADSAKTLKSGDVLISIGGKPVERPEDALRLLREQPGKDVKVEVLRQRKTQTLSMRAPEFKTMFIPAPPVAPVAPLPPTPAVPSPHALPAPAPLPPSPPAPRVGSGSVAPASPMTATMAPRPPAPPTRSALPAPPAPAPPALRVEPVPAAPAAPANDDTAPRGASRSGASRIA